MARSANLRFELKRLTSTEWVINDNWFTLNDPRRTVACVDQVYDDEVEVVWLRELSLPSRYPSVNAVLSDVSRTVTASTKPMPDSAPAPDGAARRGHDGITVRVTFGAESHRLLGQNAVSTFLTCSTAGVDWMCSVISSRQRVKASDPRKPTV